jgi:hypothetical protein
MGRIAVSLSVALALAALTAAGVASPVSGGNLDNGETITVEPEITVLPDGSTETVYELPDGEVITSITPPSGFNPLTADDSLLTKYGFPLRPSDPDDLRAWNAAMSAYKFSVPATDAIQVASDTASALAIPTRYGQWGGYTAGTWSTQSRTYVAVKGNFTVPSNVGTCSDTNSVAFWIGLGGTGGDYPGDNLVQQGIECGNTHVGTGSAYRPFTQFASTANAHALCSQTDWTLPAGHVIYQNMSFQTSQNKAFFYLEDQTSGRAQSCSGVPPSGWHWDLNTAEWIGEARTGVAINFGSIRFTNARAQLYSNSNWVTLGSQPVTKTIQGDPSPLTYCISPGSISSTGAAFTDYWHSPGDCYPDN